MSRPKREVFIYRIIDRVLRAALRAFPISSWSERVALWWGLRFRPAPSVVRLRSGPLIFVDPTDYLQLLIYYLGAFEPHCLSYFRLCATKGATIVDVGANVGVYTLEGAVAAGRTGRVISIEAAPPNAGMLKRSIELNQVSNVELIEIAVGDTNESATLSLASGANLGMFTLGATTNPMSHRVQVRRIDDLLEEEE